MSGALPALRPPMSDSLSVGSRFDPAAGYHQQLRILLRYTYVLSKPVHPVDISVNTKYAEVNLSIRRLVAIVCLTLSGLMLTAACSIGDAMPILGDPVALPAVIIEAIPHVFVGTVTIGGQPAPDGTEVSVWVSDYDAPVGTEMVSGGKYSVLVLKYGDAFAGKTLIFKIADKDTGITASWKSGEATVLNLATD